MNLADSKAGQKIQKIGPDGIVVDADCKPIVTKRWHGGTDVVFDPRFKFGLRESRKYGNSAKRAQWHGSLSDKLQFLLEHTAKNHFLAPIERRDSTKKALDIVPSPPKAPVDAGTGVTGRTKQKAQIREKYWTT